MSGRVETIRSINEDFIPDSDSMPSANISPEFCSINEDFIPDSDSMPSANISPEFCSINEDFVPGLDSRSVENRINVWKEPSPV